jgi:hypothetical protein
VSVSAFLALAAASLRADDVFVTSMIGPASGEIGACPPSCTTGSVGSGSSALSSAFPEPVIPFNARRTRYGYTNDCAWAVTPMDITQTSSSGTWTFQSLRCLDLWEIFITKGMSLGCSSNLVVNMTVDAATTLYASPDDPVTSLSLYQFQAHQPNNVWIPVGYIRNTTPNPTVTFTYASGTISKSDRWYMDAVWFHSICWYSPRPARITNIIYGNPIIISGTGAVEHYFALVSSTNAAQALNLWTREQTNTARMGLFTFSVTPGTENARFFRVITQ